MSPKRDLLLNTALALFYQFGINSVGINEVLKVSGVAKKTLYSHFESKDELVLSALNLRHQTFINWLTEKLDKVSSDNELIDTLFKSLESWFNGHEAQLGDFRGCFFINTAAEFSDPNCNISRYCKFHKEQVRQLIKRKLQNDTSELLDAICLLKEGAITTAYLTRNTSEPISTSLKILHRLES